VARTLVTLGRLRLERGRLVDAEKALAEAAARARDARDVVLETRALGWQAAVWVDATRLVEAETSCRDLLSAGRGDAAGRVHLAATLSRALLWQGRIGEARASLSDEACEDGEVCVYAGVTASRVHLAGGDVFAAGRLAHAAAEAIATPPDPIVRVVALTGLLRVALAAGDLRVGRHYVDAIDGLAREVHCGLRAVRGRLMWAGALARAGRIHDARREIGRLERRRRALPPLLRRQLDLLEGASVPPPSIATPAAAWRAAADLVTTANQARTDVDGVAAVAERARLVLGCTTVEIVRSPPAPAASGEGRVCEIGVPVTREGGVRGTLCASWPPGAIVPGEAHQALEVVAALLAPWVEGTAPGNAAAAVPELVGGSASMQALGQAVLRAARAPFAVLIEGESGSGKELVARALHRLSPRRERPFRDVNCAAIPDELVESELFGHVAGAFTGAAVERAGLFEEADGGTIFLDEVADLSVRAQAKILRVIQEQEVRRLGSGTPRRVDARVVAAANRDLRREAAAGRFRPDLLYRLDVIRIRVPPLRERLEDVPSLARHFWREATRRVGSTASLDARVVERLCAHRWPGNVRELQNVIACLAVQAPARGRVGPDLLPDWLDGPPEGRLRRLADARRAFERELVESALVRAGGRRAGAARELGLSRQGLLKLMARVGLASGRGGGSPHLPSGRGAPRG